MPNDRSTPRASDDPETAERKSKTVDERVPTQETDAAAESEELPGAVTRGGPLASAAPSPGEIALEHESKAQRGPTIRG